MTHQHPNPALERFVHYGAAALMALMLLGAVALVGLALVGFPLLLLGAVILLLLIAPVLMLTTATPAVHIDGDGLTIQPILWRSHRIRWDDITVIKDYPLLPPHETEVGRRAMVGRRNYRPAQGKMLLVPSLPVQYRITGVFAGEGFTPVIALTNRTHTDYDHLITHVLEAYEGANR